MTEQNQNSKTKVTAKQRLLDAAAELFYDYGIAATGIDTITAHAGVAKKSLYNNFSSKAQLVAYYLQIRHQQWLGLYQHRLNEAKTPKAQIMAIFLAYQDHAECAYPCGFRGCGLLNAAAELPANAPGRQVVKQHKEEVEGLLAAHLATFFNDDQQKAKQTAKLLSFILEGSIVRAGLEGHSQCLQDAQIMIDQLLDTP